MCYKTSGSIKNLILTISLALNDDNLFIFLYHSTMFNTCIILCLWVCVCGCVLMYFVSILNTLYTSFLFRLLFRMKLFRSTVGPRFTLLLS